MIAILSIISIFSIWFLNKRGNQELLPVIFLLNTIFSYVYLYYPQVEFIHIDTLQSNSNGKVYFVVINTLMLLQAIVRYKKLTFNISVTVLFYLFNLGNSIPLKIVLLTFVAIFILYEFARRI